MDTGLNGKTVLITGGSMGIGKASALAFGREAGARVAVTYFKNEASAQEVVASIEQDGGAALAVYMSLGDHASIEKAVETIVGKFSTSAGSILVGVQRLPFTLGIAPSGLGLVHFYPFG